jgi:hypothetical protein
MLMPLNTKTNAMLVIVLTLAMDFLTGGILHAALAVPHAH